MNFFKGKVEKGFIFIFIIGFITSFLLYLTLIIIVPNDFEIPIIMFIGLAIFILLFFYLLYWLNIIPDKVYSIQFKGLNENNIKLIIFFFMIMVYFIPANDFSDLSIDWGQISYLNYLRAIVFLFGSAFIPGSCLFNIFFPKSKIHVKIGVEPFLLKVVLYPVLSFTFLGSICFIMDRIGLMRDFFSPILFITIIILFCFDFALQKHRFKKISKIQRNNYQISKYSIFICLIAISIIILSIGFYSKSKYLFFADAFRILSHVELIGKNSNEVLIYSTYWSYISFSLSKLSGIPVINNDTLLNGFLYLPFVSIYILIKVILYNFKKNYVILASIFIISFSNLFLPFLMLSDRNLISSMTLFSMYIFIYKGFSIVLSIVASVLFISAIYWLQKKGKNDFGFNTILKMIILSSFLLVQSYVIYYIPMIPAISLFFLIYIFSQAKRVIFKEYLILIASLIIFFIFFDVCSNFYFSWTPTSFLLYFADINLHISNQLFQNARFFNALIIYSILVSFTVISYTFYRKNVKIFTKLRMKVSSKIDVIYIIKLCFILFTGLLFLEIFLNFVFTLRDIYFFTSIIHYLYGNIGFIGIIGIYSLIIAYKRDSYIFKVLLSWFIVIMGIAFSFIILEWLKNPSYSPLELQGMAYSRMTYWFSRTWYYAAIPLSCFSIYGLIKLHKLIKKIGLKLKKFQKSIIKLTSISMFLFLTLSNTIISGINWYNVRLTLNDDHFQIIGWISKNTPANAGILADEEILYRFTDELTLRRSYLIDSECSKALKNSSNLRIIKYYDENCSIGYLEEFNGNIDVLYLSDNNKTGLSSLLIGYATNIVFGTVAFNFQSSNASKNCSINYYSAFGKLSLSFLIEGNGLYYYNGSDYEQLIELTNNNWYQYKLDFECSSGNYKGLSANEWRLSLNGSILGIFSFNLTTSYLVSMEMFSSINDANYSVYFNNVYFSWYTNINIIYYIFDYLLIFSYLSDLDISFLILSKEKTKFRENAEKYIDVEGKLIPLLYSTESYAYGNYIIYNSMDF